jgi:hypothetical protein
VLINVQVGDACEKPLIIEVQLLLNDFFIIKGSQHRYYEIERAGSLEDLLKTPLFQDTAGGTF